MTLIPRRIRHLQNLYADNIHMVSYSTGVKVLGDPESGTHRDMTLISWAVTREERNSRESWKAQSGDEFKQDFVDKLNCEWEDGISAKEVINGAPEVIKVGANIYRLYGQHLSAVLNTW
jgi:hypothetical protein